jgi:riboflavin synthase
MNTKSIFIATTLAPFLFAGASIIGFVGCEQKEKVIDVDTPLGDVEVEKSKDGHDVDVRVHEPEKRE